MTSRKQITINGKICQNQNGYYWCLSAVFEGLDKCLSIDSSKSETYFEDQEKAHEAVLAAGRDLAEQLADILNVLVDREAAFVLDKSNMH